ncbi:MAG: hypothetical protein IT323_10970 [Anaerolineae bacterium]|nr:hypothetical protein [Anaerolineae bacterium]
MSKLVGLSRMTADHPRRQWRAAPVLLPPEHISAQQCAALTGNQRV